MKITRIEVEGFGVWSGLRIERLSETINVFHGANEAGKTTLLEFIRSMFYGSGPRNRYLPPSHGGPAGGTLDLAGPHGRFQIVREFAIDGAEDSMTLSAPDGTRQGEHFLKTLLSNTEEPIFNNVFAVGLREIQELATLSDTAAAELLYNLTVGLDRVSLVEVIQALAASRNRVLDVGGAPCQVTQLLAEREKLLSEIEDLSSINHRYAQLAAERARLHAEVTRLEEEAHRIERLVETMDLAVAVREPWARRTSLDEQLASLGTVKNIAAGTIEKLDDLNARIEKRRRRIEQLAELRGRLKREFAELEINDALRRSSPRIESLLEQEPWILQLQRRIVELEKEVGDAALQWDTEIRQLGLTAEAAATWGETAAFLTNSKRLAALRVPARRLREEHRRLAEARRAATAAERVAESLDREIEAVLTPRGTKSLAAALEQAGRLVSQSRRRLQIDERLEQLARQREDLEERNQELMDRQPLPVGVLGGIGAVFVLGFVLVLVGLVMQSGLTSSFGYALAPLGAIGIIAAILSKRMLERLNLEKLDAIQKQLELLHAQVRQTESDRDALDAQLPRGGGPIPSRIQAAERELASLEELGPSDARRNAARQEAEALSRRAGEAKIAYREAKHRWRTSATAAGLPAEIAFSQVRRLMARAEPLAQLQRRLVEWREELVRRRQEMDSIASRVAQLATDVGLVCQEPNGVEEMGVPSPVGQENGGRGGEKILAQLRALAAAAAEQEAVASHRESLRLQSRHARAAQIKHGEAAESLARRRRDLFVEAGVRDEQELRGRALESARAETIRQDRAAAAHEIEAAVAARCSEDAIRGQLDDGQAASLNVRLQEARQRQQLVEEQLRGLLEQRGRLGEQIDTLAADRQLGARRLDLAVVEKRLFDAVRRWQVLASVCGILDGVRDTYETDRQPETLREASGYLDRLTQGRYRRVWTPLGEHALRVDDAEGRPRSVETMSRGSREQLFLSLRLALAGSYARRGAPLPLVLDDVLVNFDAARAKAAAAVLTEFAAEGHQLLVFTCHEHILKLFKSLKVPTGRLPDNSKPGQTVALSDRGDGAEKPKRAVRRALSPRSRIRTVEDAPTAPASMESDERADDSLWDEAADDGSPFDDDGGEIAVA